MHWAPIALTDYLQHTRCISIYFFILFVPCAVLQLYNVDQQNASLLNLIFSHNIPTGTCFEPESLSSRRQL